MDAASWAVIVGPITTLLGGLGGYWLAGRNEEARDRRAVARDTASRQAALAERLEEQRHDVQTETLLKLQDEVLHLSRVGTRIVTQQARGFQETGRLVALGDLGEEKRQVTDLILVLRTRLLDADLRKAIGEYVRVASAIAERAGLSGDTWRTELDRREMEQREMYSALNAQLGERLRQELDRRSLATEPARLAALFGENA